jgi:hypothetical protein
MYTVLKYQCKTPLGHQYTLKKMKDRRVKQDFSGGRYLWERGRLKEMVDEGEYGGFILYSYMKIEE